MSRKAVDPSEKILDLFLNLGGAEQELILKYLQVHVRHMGQTLSEATPRRPRKAKDERLAPGQSDPRD